MNMFKMLKNKKGFTLIELMIVVAIVGILAAIAIPAYLDYTVKAKITEVTTAMDALAQAACEYQASAGYFPNYPGDPAADSNFTNTSGFAAVSTTYAQWTYAAQDQNDCTFTATFNNALNPVANDTLIMDINFSTGTGYTKQYDSNSTIPPKYIPKK